ncbi:MAG: DUF1801 domain-containing protein [Thermaceae bacterium]|nr:DUF1801 domain-containing protein [Thermaceae bacterium]
MTARKRSSSASVSDYIAGLPEGLRAEVEALRRVILSAAEGIGEEVKWNAPSFHAGEHFATMRLKGKVPLQLILHLGAKKSIIPRSSIEDPTGLLEWLGPDRACVSFTELGEVNARASALQAILRQWLQHVPGRDPS